MAEACALLQHRLKMFRLTVFPDTSADPNRKLLYAVSEHAISLWTG